MTLSWTPSIQDNAYFDDSYFGEGNYFLNDPEGFGSLEQIDDGMLGSLLEQKSAVEFDGPAPSQRNGKSISSPVVTSSKSSPIETSLSKSTSPRSDIIQLGSKSIDESVEDFLDGLTFLKSPLPTTSINDASRETVAEEINVAPEPTKRLRGNRADFLSACWTSPLCPNSNKGTPPDPATCGGACAPFLFCDPTLPETIDSSFLPQDDDNWATVEAIQETLRPSLKRSDRVLNSGTGRKISSKSDDSKEKTVVKTESISSAKAQIVEEGKEDNEVTARKRQPHNQIERKYRESLNTQLESLRRVVPALQQNRTPPCDGADIEDLPSPSKPSKALILASATAYIKQIEREKKQAVDENAVLRARIKALQSLVKCEDCSLVQYVMDMKLHSRPLPGS